METYDELDKENERGRAAAHAQSGSQAASMLGDIGEIVGGATMLTAKGVFHLTSGAVRGAVGVMQGMGASSDSDDDVVELPASPSNANPTSTSQSKHSDLEGMSTNQLRELLMEMVGDNPSSSLQKLGRSALISRIKKMRG